MNTEKEKIIGEMTSLASTIFNDRQILKKSTNAITSSLFGSPFPLTQRADPPVRQDGVISNDEIAKFSSSPAYGRSYEEMLTDGSTIFLNPGKLVFKGSLGLLTTLAKGAVLTKNTTKVYKQQVLLPGNYFNAVRNAARDIANQFKEEYKGYYETRGQENRVASYEYFAKDSTSENIKTYFKSLTKGLGVSDRGVVVPFFTYGDITANSSVSNEVGKSSIQQAIESTRDANGISTLLKEYIANTSKGNVAKNQYVKKDGIIQKISEDMGVGKAAMFYNPIIPKLWKNSTAGATYSFTLKLVSPYGDPDSRYRYLFMPLMYLIPMVFPKDQGPSNLGFYTAPYTLTVHAPGKFYIPTAMISSMSITPGDINKKGNLMSLSVEINITDLQPLMVSSDVDHKTFMDRSRNRLTQTMLAYGGFSTNVIAQQSVGEYAGDVKNDIFGFFNVGYNLSNLYENTVQSVKSRISLLGVNHF